MKKIIEYHDIEHGANMFATPKFTKSEIVEVDSQAELDKYIESKKDLHGGKFKKQKQRTYGYDYISHAGGVKVKDYKRPKIKKI